MHTRVLDYGRHPELSPFLLLDHAGPADFRADAQKPRGVGWHPHRGFETVTVVLDGEVDHRGHRRQRRPHRPRRRAVDDRGARACCTRNAQRRSSRRRGGQFHALQLWVNLPAKSKMTAPHYQTLLARDIPSLNLTGGVSVRVIAGEFRGVKGPASTFTPVRPARACIPAGRDADLGAARPASPPGCTW